MSAAEQLVTFCGCLGQLRMIGDDAGDAAGCLVWRTDAQLLRDSGPPVAVRGSLLQLACDVAELYHHKHTLQLAGQPDAVEVFWLELADDGSLLVFLKPPLKSPAPASVPGLNGVVL